MIISQTPLRISFLGGGTDYPLYFHSHGGQTLGTSINKYNIITVSRLTQFVDYRIRIHYSQVESVKHIDEIDHPSARECLRFLGLKEGIEVHYLSDLPARTGLGSSSAATVGLLTALHAFKGEKASKEQVAKEAVYVEQELIKERVGCQDQYTCAIGGFLHLEFQQNQQVRIEPLKINRRRIDELQSHLVLLYTGMQREAHKILDEQIERTRSGANEEGLAQLKGLVKRGIEVLIKKSSLLEFGELLHQAWMIKRQLSSKISTSFIDDAYERARQAGAIGGKILGAGGGGFLLLFAQPKNHQRVLSAVPDLYKADFSFEHSGTEVIFHKK